MAASTVWEILKTAGLDPAPDRARTTWARFLRSQAQAILAMDFTETVTLTGQRQYILAAIHHASRQVRILGTTAHPTHAWLVQAIRNLLIDLEDNTGRAQIRFLIRDRDRKYPALMDNILDGAGIATVPTLIWNETHLRRALHEYEQHYNQHRTHRSLAAAAPLRARPQILDPASIECLTVRRQDQLGGLIHEYQHAA